MKMMFFEFLLMIIEIINKNSKNIIIGTTYRPPSGKIKPFKSYFKNLFEKSNQTNKVMYFLGDFNLNVLNYDTDSRVKNFFNMMFKYGMISIINKPTRVAVLQQLIIYLQITFVTLI